MSQLSENIKHRRKELGITQDELARLAGYNDRSSIAKIESGLVDLPESKIAQFAQALRTTMLDLLGVGGIDTRRVRRLGTIACGSPIVAEENFEGYDEVPNYINCDFTLVCKGDSMINARIYDGDIVCIKQQPAVENGQIAAVLIDEGTGDSAATLKRVRFTSNGVTLWPENPLYEPMVFTGDDVNKVKVLGLATHFISVVR